MKSEALRDLVVDALDEIKGQEIVTLDVRKLTDITDYMVVASGGTDRQVRSLADNVLLRAKEAGVQAIGVEGREGHEWVLIDLGDVVAHLMQPKVREFYELEQLWAPLPTRGDSSRSGKTGSDNSRSASVKSERGDSRS